MSSKDNLALDLEHGVRRWDRARWISVFSSHNPTIREVTECLGLGLSASSSTTNRGIPKFDNPDYRKLSSEVTKLSKELPKERDALLDFAADLNSLSQELEDLLASYGPAIWGRDADRSCLLTASPTKKTYNRDLFYEEPEHKNILKIHLHRWIIIKACYYIRNMKLKRPSGANEYDQLADIDGDGLSPHRTSQSLTPPDPDTIAGANLDVKPINLKKRKSNSHFTTSDDEDFEASPVKRPYNTMPVSRNGSPRKSLKSLYPAGSGSMENILPMPTHIARFSSAPGTASEPGRLKLSPLSNSDLNGVSRPPAVTQNSTSSAPGGFTAVNTGNFTAVNNTPPASEPPREAAREVTREPSREVHRPPPAIGHRHSNSYTSPYEPSSHSAAMARSATDTPRSALSTTPTPAPGQGFQAVNASSAVNGASAHMKESLAVQPAQHAPIAPQPQQPQPQGSQQTPSHASNQHQASPHGQPHHTQHAHLPSHPHIQAQQQPPPRSPSRANTPGHLFSRSLAPHPRSRSSTPHAQAAPNQPTMAANKQATSAPSIQSAPTYGIQLVPTQEAPTAPSSRQRAPSNHNQSTAPQHTSPHQPVLKAQQQSEIAYVVQPPQTYSRGSVSTADLRLLQCEVTAGLFTFFYPRSTMPPDEAALLVRIHTLWFHGEALFRAELPKHFDLVSKILTAWLHERQAIASLRHSMQANPGVSHVGLVDRLLAMNDLRAMRLKWKNMSSVDGLSPEDLLCMAFRAMTNTEGSECLFKDGLARLELGVFEFLRSEDSKIVMLRRDTRAE